MEAAQRHSPLPCPAIGPQETNLPGIPRLAAPRLTALSQIKPPHPRAFPCGRLFLKPAFFLAMPQAAEPSGKRIRCPRPPTRHPMFP